MGVSTHVFATRNLYPCKLRIYQIRYITKNILMKYQDIKLTGTK